MLAILLSFLKRVWYNRVALLGIAAAVAFVVSVFGVGYRYGGKEATTKLNTYVQAVELEKSEIAKANAEKLAELSQKALKDFQSKEAQYESVKKDLAMANSRYSNAVTRLRNANSISARRANAPDGATCIRYDRAIGAIDEYARAVDSAVADFASQVGTVTGAGDSQLSALRAGYAKAK